MKVARKPYDQKKRDERAADPTGKLEREFILAERERSKKEYANKKLRVASDPRYKALQEVKRVEENAARRERNGRIRLGL